MLHPSLTPLVFRSYLNNYMISNSGTWDVYFLRMLVNRNFQMCSHQKLSSNINNIEKQNNTLQILRLGFDSSKAHWIMPCPWVFTLRDSNDIAAKNLQLCYSVISSLCLKQWLHAFLEVEKAGNIGQNLKYRKIKS